MSATADQELAELRRAYAELRKERDSALAELQTRTTALAQRDSEYRERIQQQSATIDVLKVMSASPDDPQPVFDLIVTRARDLCDAYGVTVYEFDGSLIHWRASTGVSDDPSVRQSVEAMYPMAPSHEWGVGRAIMDRRIHRIDDLETEPGLNPALRAITAKSQVALPLMHGDMPIGALALGSRERGGFSDSQVTLLQTFAEQAVIAITSAETYRALQVRTTDLQESLEYQTAVGDVLKVISRSAFGLQPVLDAVVTTAGRLCNAEMAAMARREGDLFRMVAQFGFPPDFVADRRSRGAMHLDENSVTGRAALEGRVIHVQDAGSEPDYPEDAIRLGKQRSSLGVPLLRDNEVMGVIVLARQQVEPFTDRQIELVSTFADQAVIAMENARLMDETREALEQQTATAEVLQVINTSPGNLVPVFDAMLERALELCGAAFGTLYTFDGELFKPVAFRGVAPGFAELMTKYPPTRRPGSPAARTLETKQPVDVPDLTAEENYRSGLPAALGLVEIGGFRAFINVPLVKDGEVLGIFTIYRRNVGNFSDKQIALLKNFAAQAIIAMENARLLTETREALEQQTATAEVLQVINGSPGNLAPVFEAMVDRARRLCGAEFGVFALFDGVAFHPFPSKGSAATTEPLSAEPGSALADLVCGTEFVHISDVRDTDAYRSGVPGRVRLVEREGARTALWVALRKDDVLLGTFITWRKEVRAFSTKEIGLMQNFAAQAVIAMENARLITETREALEQQTATAEVLQVINSSPGDLAPVFDAILEKAHTFCGAEFGSLFLYDGEHFRAIASHGVPEALASRLREGIGNDSWASRQLIAGRPFTHIHDSALEEHAVYRGMDMVSSHRSLLSVPLRKGNALLGKIVAGRLEARPFTDKQIALLQSFAAQAVIAMDNARLLTETREALEQQTATAEVLQVINASPGDLTPVFEAMLEKAMRLCEAAFGSLYTYDGAGFRSAAHRGVPRTYAEWREQVPPSPRTAVLARLLEEKRSIHVHDVMQGEDYLAGSVVVHKMVELGGIRTTLSVPLLKDDAMLGFIMIYRQEVRAFSDKQIALLESFAAQAVIAIENARLLDELRQRQEELRITFENMGDGVALFDETRRLAASNRRFQDMLDVPDDVILSRPTFADYIRYLADHGEYGLDPEDHIAHLLTLGSQPATFERTRPNGRIIEVRGNPVSGGGFVVIYSDITDRKRNEEELRAARDAAEEASRTIEAAYRDLKAAQASLIQAEKMASLGQLTAGIAHEIKNPLNFVNNFASLSVDLLDEIKQTAAPGFAVLDEARRAELDDLTSTLASNLDKINEHGRRADGIVRSMLEHSRGSSGERREVDLSALVDEALNLAYHGARARDQSFSITLQREFGENIAPIMLAPQDVTRVLLNVLSNGFYAARERQRAETTSSFEPTLKVSTCELGDAVEIKVRDNGIGIPPEVKDRLFQPFFTTKPTGEGTGLGLSMSYDIVTQQHGGSITVDSNVGEYSEFTVRLPRNP